MKHVLNKGVESIKNLKIDKPKKVVQYFGSEEISAKNLNPYILRFFTKFMIA